MRCTVMLLKSQFVGWCCAELLKSGAPEDKGRRTSAGHTTVYVAHGVGLLSSSRGGSEHLGATTPTAARVKIHDPPPVNSAIRNNSLIGLGLEPSP